MRLTAGQLRALFSAAMRELLWGLRAASREIDRWREHALAIPDAQLRDDALGALGRKRTHIVGAALFCTLPQRRDVRLLRTLIAYEVLLEFLDNAHERACERANGRQLHRALVEALDPSAAVSDYYLHHPGKNDSGYLRALVEVCREGCRTLPSYEEVRTPLLVAAERCGEAQSSNHEAGRQRSGAALEEWVRREFPQQPETHWWELSAAASSSLVVHALLALAASPDGQDYAQVGAAYVPWICALSTMLDSYTDLLKDAAEGQHSYLAYYPDGETAVRRICELIERSAYEVGRLRDGPRHVVILASMVAMYLSSDSARMPAMRDASRRIATAGGFLTRLLVPILRLWRIAYAQRSA